MNLNGLEKYFKTNENGNIFDFKQVNNVGWSPLCIALRFNRSEKFHLNTEKLNYLIENSDLKQVVKNGWSPLMYAINYNKSQNLNLNSEQLDYLIKNSDLKQIEDFGSSPLMLALMYNKVANLNLTNEQWKYMINNSDLSLITGGLDLIELKKIQSELLNEQILVKIEIKNKIKLNKI